MTYIPGTLLTRKDPQEDEYDEVRVVGQSPISYTSGRESEWEGQDSAIVSITPHIKFGSVVDVSQGQLEQDYEVTEIPDKPPTAMPQDAPPARQLSAEDAFKEHTRHAKTPSTHTA